jgi:hypothetical protein
MALNLLVVGWVFVIESVHQEVSQVLEGLNVWHGIGLELGEVSDGLGGVRKERLVNEMPVLLPVIAHRLDHISEGSALNKRMVSWLILS